MGFGPTPVSEIYSYLETVPEVVRSGIEVEMAFRLLDAQMFGYTGRFDEARESFRLGRRSLCELGRRTHFVGMAMFLGQIELAAGELEAAEQVFREGYDGLGELGETGYRSTMTTMLADTLVRLGRIDEADDLLEVADELSLADDADPQVRMRWVRGKVLAERGDLAEGERVAREAVSLASATDYLVLHGDALLALADVLVTAGKDDEALAALHDAVELYDRKEATAHAATARGADRGAALGAEPRVVLRGEAKEQVVQRAALLGVERGEELLLDALRDRAELCERLASLRRQRHQVAPAVDRIPLAQHEPALLEVVEQADDLAAVVVEPVGDHPLRGAGALVEDDSTAWCCGCRPVGSNASCHRSLTMNPSRFSRNASLATSSLVSPGFLVSMWLTSCEKCSASKRCRVLSLWTSTILGENE